MDASKREKSLIAKLAKGNLSSVELEELQTLAKHDPFLSDAIEGYLESPKNHSKALHNLRGKVLKPKRRPGWLSIAAGILILIGFSLFLVNRFQGSLTEGLVMQQNKHPRQSDQESFSTTEDQIDSEAEMTDIALQNTPPEVAKERKLAKNDGKSASSATGIPKISTIELEEEMTDESEVEVIPAEKMDDALAFDQRKTGPLVAIQGRVFDDVGEPLIGVDILQPDLGIGTHTDLEGRFVLNTPDTNQDIAVSFVGFKSKVVSEGISPNKDLDIKLEQNAILDEVVVTSLPRAKQARSVSNDPTEKDQRAFQNFIKKNLQYPTAAKEAGIAGSVQLSFNLEADGTPTKIQVTKSLGYGCDQEAIRLLKNSPRWSQTMRQSASESESLHVKILFTL